MLSRDSKNFIAWGNDVEKRLDDECQKHKQYVEYDVECQKHKQYIEYVDECQKHNHKCPTGPRALLGGIQAQLVGSGSGEGTVANGANVIFDTVTNDKSAAISYNAGTGEFTVTALGNYYVSWWVAVDGTEGPATVNFAINLNGGGSVTGSLPLVTGQVVGSALITVSTVPSTITLVNNTTATVGYATTLIQANIVITEVS